MTRFERWCVLFIPLLTQIIEMIELQDQISHSMGFYDICVRMMLQESILVDMNR